MEDKNKKDEKIYKIGYAIIITTDTQKKHDVLKAVFDKHLFRMSEVADACFREGIPTQRDTFDIKIIDPKEIKIKSIITKNKE